MTRKSDVAYWIKEREKIRIAKESGMAQRDWTDDPILATYRFCNVHREDDTVTKWVHTNYRLPHRTHNYFTRALALARLINWPPTLEVIGYPSPWEPDKIIRILQHLRLVGKAWGSAYIVSTNGLAMDKAEYVVNHVLAKVPADRHIVMDTLEETHRRLMTVNGFGSFIAAQVIADLKNTPGNKLQSAPDRLTWAAPGPGSLRGLSRYYGGQIAPRAFLTQLRRMADEVWPLVARHTRPLCMQDWQNVMCEFDKYDRTADGSSKPKATYKPRSW